MKAILKAYSTSLLFTTLALSTLANDTDPLVEKKKNYSKSYSVSNSDKVSIDNQFGEMKISTWDKNEVKVEVTITAEAGTDERAQAILDNIKIEDGKSGSSVWFKTKMGNDNNNNNRREKGEKTSFSIDYVVMVPARGILDASNQFGPMSIGDYNGEVELESKFGSLTAGKLTNAKRVSVEFGKANIAGMKNGKLSIKFSRGLVSNLDGSVKADFEHCSGVKLIVDNDTKELNINNSFTKLYLDVTTNLSASFDISTSFCDVRNNTSFTINKEGDDEDRRGPKFDFKYSGKAGSGSTTMRIKSSFGDVTVGHNISFDVEAEDKKDKDRKRTRNI
jgi:hypothetical protein